MPYVDVSNGAWMSDAVGLMSWLRASFSGPAQLASYTYTTTKTSCLLSNGSQGQYLLYNNVLLWDQTGAPHSITPWVAFYTDCDGNSSPAAGSTFITDDGSGYTLVSQTAGSPYFKVYDRTGNLVTATAAVSPAGLILIGDTNTYTGVTSTPGYVRDSYTDAYGESLLTVTANVVAPPAVSEYPTSTTFSYTDSSGTQQTATINYTQYTVQTNFQCESVADWAPHSDWLPSSIDLPNHRQFTFSYEPTPGYPAKITQRIASIGLPNGGSISYEYSGGNSGVYCGTLVPPAAGMRATSIIPTLTRTVNDGSGHSSSWTYNIGLPATQSEPQLTSVIDAAGNTTVFTFRYGYQTQKQVYEGSAETGTLLQTVTTCYNGNFSNCPTWPTPTGLINDHIAVNQTDVYTSYNSGPASLVETKLDAAGLPTEVKKYDYGAMMPPTGSPISDTTTAYGSWNGSTCVSLPSYIQDHPCEITTSDASGVLSDTINSYDASGNLLQTSSLATGSTYVTKHYTYTDNGSLKTATDGNQNLTTYTEGACNSLLPTTVSTGGIAVQEQWDCNGGVLTSTTGPNAGQTTTYTYADPLYRLTATSYPDGGGTSLCYSDVGGPTCSRSSTTNSVTSIMSAAPSPDQKSVTTSDGLGRVAQTVSGDGATIDYTYNASGGMGSVSNPYLSTNDSTYGTTSYQYDALGRLLSQCQPDNTPVGATTCVPNNSFLGYTYNNNQTTVTDEGGNAWVRTADGLGRLTNTVEPGGAQTEYRYNGLADLTAVIQHGVSGEASRTRSFTYDFLSRLVTAANPESGTVCFGLWSGGAVGSGTCQNGYDGNGNMIARTDATNRLTSYTYDNLDRLVSKSYSDDTPSSCYQYDSASQAVTNSIGLLVVEWTQKGGCPASLPSSGVYTRKSVLAYDSVGRITKLQQCVLGNCVNGGPFTLSQTYDLAGNTISWTDGIGINTFSKGFDALGRPLSIVSSQGTGSQPNLLFSVQMYTPASALQNWTLGQGLSLSRTYDNRNRVNTESVINP